MQIMHFGYGVTLFGILVALAGCRNDAITFAHIIEPGADCTALKTNISKSSSDTDTAVCRVASDLLACEAHGDDIPSCKKIGVVKVEQVKP